MHSPKVVKHTNRNGAMMFDLNFQLHSLVNPQKLFVRLWNKRYITCTWNKCQKMRIHCHSIDIYLFIPFYITKYWSALLHLHRKKPKLLSARENDFFIFFIMFPEVYIQWILQMIPPQKTVGKTSLCPFFLSALSTSHTLVRAGKDLRISQKNSMWKLIPE